MKNSDCLNASIAVMSYTGVWKNDKLSFRWNFLYIIFAVVVQIFLFYLVVVAELAYVFKVNGDIEKTTEAAVLLLSHLVQGVKVLTIWFRQNRIKRLIAIIDGPNFTKSDPAKQAILEDLTQLATLVSRLFIFSAAITALFWCIVPLLKAEMMLPLKTAYPFDINHSPTFGIMYAYSTISVVVVGVGDAAENYLVAGLTLLPTAQLDVLCKELAEIGTDKTNDYVKTVSCIKYHQNIIEYVEELAAIFGLPIFCQCLTSSVILCMTVFKITITTEPIELMTMIFYLICIFLELLVYCYPGDLLINKSLLVAEAACLDNWSGDVRSQRALLLAVLRAQRPLKVNAGGVFRVCLPTAAAIVQTSYSYYNILRQKTNN